MTNCKTRYNILVEYVYTKGENLEDTNENKKYICYFDASQKENNAAIAYIVKNAENKTILQSSKTIECNSSHIAEAKALTELLGNLSNKNDECLMPKKSEITIYGDCRGVIDFIKNRTKYTNCKYKETYNPILYYYLKLKEDNVIALKWIRRTKNKEADAIARKLLKQNKVA